MMLLLLGAADAAELPSIDTPVKTGLRASRDSAVVIGIENYVYLPPATYATRDAQAMFDFLVYTRGVPASRVTLLQSGTSRRKILDAVASAGAETTPGGTVWVYYAGHGSASPSTRERLLLPENTLAEAGDFDEQGVQIAELQRLASAGGAEVIMISDACFTGAGRAGGTLLADGRAWVPPTASAMAGAAQWDAAQANQVAAPLDAVAHGAFTYFAIGAMRGWADGQVSGVRDGVVSAEEAQLYVQEALRTVGIRDQVPSLVGDGASTRTLATGVQEPAPALRPPAAAAAPTPVSVGDASIVAGADFRAELEKAKREAAQRAEREFRAKAEAEAKARAEAEARAIAAEQEAEAAAARKVKLDAAEAQLRAQATADWEAARSLVESGSPEGQAAAEAYVKAYGTAKVKVDEEVRPVVIAEVELARAAVGPAPAPTTTALPHELNVRIVDTMLRSNKSVKQCFAAHRATAGSLPSGVKVKFTVQPNGKVSSASQVAGDGMGSTFATCLSAAVASIQFPPFQSSAVTMTYPFKLQ